MGEREEFLEDFLVESEEHLENLINNLLEMEKGDADPENKIINEVFRAAHSLKGLAGLLRFHKMQSVTHKMENILDRIRKGVMPSDTHTLNVIFEGTDFVKKTLEIISGTGSEDTVSPDEIIAKLQHILDAKQKNCNKEQFEIPSSSSVVEVSTNSETDEIGIYEIYVSPLYDIKHLNGGLYELICLLGTIGEVVSMFPYHIEEQQDFIQGISIQEADSSFKIVFVTIVDLNEILELTRLESRKIIRINLSRFNSTFSGIMNIFAENQSNENVAETAQFKGEDKEVKEMSAREEKPLARVAQTIRVNTGRLDNLMGLVGELVLLKSQMTQLSKKVNILRFEDDSDLREFPEIFSESTAYMNRLMKDLQQSVMQIRMFPIKQVFGKFPRVVRDLALRTGKEISLKMSGEDTELDKNIIEEIFDPLMHLIRNAADHGIENSGERLGKDKPSAGVISLNASHQGGFVIIEISDDGRGINLASVKQKALEKGLIKKNDLLSESETIDLIFEPGFSTVQNVTDISGRGVGMDVVKNNITKLNGLIDIKSEVEKGTTFKIKLPLTLAIIQTLLVKVTNQTFAVPLSCVIENLMVDYQEIKTINKKEVIDLRGNVLPLIRLQDFLGLKRKGTDEKKESAYIVVVGVAEKRIGLIVDAFQGQQEAVIKPLDSSVVDSPVVSGAMLLGDGKIVLILDIAYLVHEACQGKRKQNHKRIRLKR